ncbi:hypothetical protein EsH8_IX_000305 [Colletotrichum jinshuiense]
MPPRRRARGDDDDTPPIMSRGGAAVSSNLPPLASRFDTSYGSAPSTSMRNTRRGQRRNLQDIVKDALDDSDDSGVDDGSNASIGESNESSGNRRPTPRRSKRTQSKSPKPSTRPKRSRRAQPDPEPEPELDFEPDFGPGRDSDSPDPLRDATPEQPIAHKSPRRRVPARIAPTIESAAFQAEAPTPRQTLLPGGAPPRGQNPSNWRSTPGRASSEGPVLSRGPGDQPSLSGNAGATSYGGRLPAASANSVFARAISEEPRTQHQRRFTQQQDPPEPTPTPDSVRTFGQESSLFGGADIGSTPSPPSHSPEQYDRLRIVEEEEEESPPFEEEKSAQPIVSPPRHLLRGPTHNPPMPPRTMNQVDRPQEPVRPPITTVTDRPAPDIRPPQNTLPPPQPQLPSTPDRYRSRPPRQSPRQEPPTPPNQRQSSPKDSPGTAATLRQARVNAASASPSPAARSNSTLTSPHAIEEPYPPRRISPQKPPQLTNRSPVRPVAARPAPNVNPAPFRAQFNRVQPSNLNPLQPAGGGVRSTRPLFDNMQSEAKQNRRPTPGQSRPGMFTSEMQAKIQQEHAQDKAQQEALRIERKARLQAWPRVYNTVYSWTHAARPHSPVPSDDGSDSFDESIRPSRQIPLSESSWSTWILFKLADTFVDILNFLFSPDAWYIKALLGVLLVSFLGWGALSGFGSAPALGLGGIQWYGMSDISHNLGQFIPLWLSRPSTILSDDDAREYMRQQRNHEYEITKLMTSSKLHEGSLSRLEQIVPKVVHMNLDKHGRPVVGQEFYHALRDLMKVDTDVLTMDRGHGGYHFISDEHWRAIRDRLKKDPVYQSAASPPAPGTSATEVESIVQTTFAMSWEKWLKNNNKQVAKILEPAFGTSIPDKIGKDLEYKLEKFVKDQFKNKETKDVVVTREEFIRHLKGEFATHRNEVKAEAQELQNKLERYIKDSVEAAMNKAPPEGVSRAEMIQVVDGMVRQAIANAGLEALAQGQIGANWDSELRHQINFLAYGTGVVIDPTITSPDYVPPVNGKLGSATWFKGTKRSPQVLGTSATLFRWDDEGECWCGKVTTNKQGQLQGVDIAYMISHEIVPQHVVVEHILPGATLNPNARPRDIEIMAYITEVNARSRVADFSAAHFPGGTQPKNLKDGWVKIGQFTYESSDTLNGVHVHKLSSELVALGAVTDHIVIRMVNNHGADHTCLYRARIFGERQG